MSLTRTCRVGAALFVLILATYPFRPAGELPQTPMTEDGFYMLTVARHVAAGNGISYDGVNPTDGVQPAVLAIYAPAFLVGEQVVLPQRLVLGIELLLFVLAAFTCARVVRAVAPGDRIAPAIAALWWLSSFALFRHSLNGLETGLYLLVQLLLLLWLVKHEQQLATTAVAVRAGALLGLVTLVRIDGVFLVAGACLAYLTAWTPGRPFSERLRLALACALAAALVSGAWFARSYILFGTFMPSSGAAQAQGIDVALNLQRLAGALSQPLFPALLPVGVRFTWLALAWLGVLLAGWSAVARAGTRGTVVPSRAWVPFWVAAAGWSLFYVFSFGAPHFIERYLSPVAVPVVPLLAIALAGVLARRGTLSQLAGAAWALGIVLALAEHVVVLSGSPLATRNASYDAQYRALVAALPPGSVVGAVQSGTVGYFHSQTVNLDGKLNREALAARIEGRLPDYVAGSTIEYVVDWPGLVDVALGRSKPGWEKVGAAGGFEAWQRAYKRKRPVSPPAVFPLR